MGRAQSVLIPGHLHVAPKRLVDHEERRLEVGVTDTHRYAKWCVGGVGKPVVAYVRKVSVLGDAAELNLDVSPSLCAVIGHVSHGRNKDGGAGTREIEATEKFSVELWE